MLANPAVECRHIRLEIRGQYFRNLPEPCMSCTRLVLAASALALMAGCATPRPVGAPVDPAQTQLNAAAAAIQSSLRQLSEAEQYERMKVAPGTPHLLTQFPGLERTVTMPWNGPLEPAVMRLAAEGGYEVKVLGRPPAVPIIVQVGAEAATISDQLRSLGIQAGLRADVAVAPMTSARKGVVMIEYRNGGL